MVAGYGLPATETMMVDAIRRLAPCDRWLYYPFLLQSGGQTAIEGFRKFVGRKPGSLVEDNLRHLDPASADKAINAWLSAAQEESEDWLIPVIPILAQSNDSRAIPVLLEFAYHSSNPIVRSSAVNQLIRDVDFSKSLPSIEIILSRIGLFQKDGRFAMRKTCSASEMQEIYEEIKRDRDILSAYLRSCKRKQVHIPAQWRDFIPVDMLDEFSL
jgi:hypothetical protein